MISEKTKAPTVEAMEYPFLGESTATRQVVLFTAEKTGTVVFTTGSGRPLGYHTDDWVMDYFKPLSPDSKINLSN